MDVVKQHYIIDLSSNNNFIQLQAVQGDGNKTRYVEIELTENGKQYIVDPNVVNVSIIGTKPDTKEIWNECEITEEGYILVEITQQMVATPGRGDYQIMIVDNGENNQLKTFPFILVTVKAAFDPTYIESTDEFQKIVAALNNLSIYMNRAEQAADNAETSEQNAAESEANAASSEANAAESEQNAASSEANAAESEANAASSEQNAGVSEQNAAQSESNSEAWAVGERNGTPVTSSDETYENNSKFYAAEAKRYRDEAGMIVHVDIATYTTPGIVKPDGTTILVDATGKISHKPYTYNSSTETITIY